MRTHFSVQLNIFKSARNKIRLQIPITKDLNKYVSSSGVLISSKPDPGRKQATATKTYNTIPRLMAYKQQEHTAVVCCLKSWYTFVSLGRCNLFPSRVGLRTYQHPCKHVWLGSEMSGPVSHSCTPVLFDMGSVSIILTSQRSIKPNNHRQINPYPANV